MRARYRLRLRTRRRKVQHNAYTRPCNFGTRQNWIGIFGPWGQLGDGLLLAVGLSRRRRKVHTTWTTEFCLGGSTFVRKWSERVRHLLPVLTCTRMKRIISKESCASM